ncbi:MAG: GDP-mannose mannosyl hydrolase [Pseudomonadota bacterium]
MSWLSNETFKSVVTATPLVSIDLIIENEQGFVLLGRRVNRPAEGFWFVPGGRVQKNETLDNAFKRLTREELGCVFERQHAEFLGVYEHLYSDSVFGENPSTHYVVLGYRLTVVGTKLALPYQQHAEFQWWLPSTALSAELVHPNTKAYLS